MQTPLSVMDFLDRAELVYGDRIGVIDEPDQPAGPWGELTHRRMAEPARAQAAGLDRLGIGPGERVAIVSQNSARLLTAFYGVSGFGRVLVPVNFRLKADETAAALRDGWFHTGDGGSLRDGYLAIADRKKEVIITGGENVSSIEVEDVLYDHPAVAEVAVIGVPDQRWGETIKALVVLKPGQAADETEPAAGLIAHCKARLAGYKAPTSVEFRAALPRTSTGKLQKFRLREPYWAGHERGVN